MVELDFVDDHEVAVNRAVDTDQSVTLATDPLEVSREEVDGVKCVIA